MPIAMETVYRGFVVFGMMFVSFPMTFTLFYGNRSTCLYSLYLSRPHKLSGDLDPTWMLAIFLISSVPGTFATDVLKPRCGLKVTAFMGVSCYALGFVSTYFTARLSVWATSLTLVLLPGLGAGVIDVVSLTYVSGWFPSNFGLVSGVVFAFDSIGGMLLSPLITTCVNPRNLAPDASTGPITYFSQPEVLKRIPSIFLLVGSIIAFVQPSGTSHAGNTSHAKDW